MAFTGRELDELIELPNGAHMYRKPNGAGGYIYYSDEVGGDVVVWDTCLVDRNTILTALVLEEYRIKNEKDCALLNKKEEK